MPKLKKYLFLFFLLELFFAYAPVYAQTVPPPIYSGVDSQIRQYLCTPPQDGSSAAVTSGSLFTCINQIYKFAIVIASVVGVMYLVIAGYVYMSAEGNSESVEKAKNILTTTLTSLVILFSGYLLLKTINPDIVQLQSIQPTSTGGVALIAAPATTAAPSPATVTATSACRQTFGASKAAGCTGSSDCTNVTSLTTSHGCQSNGGVCLLSSGAAQKATNLVNSYKASGSSCTIILSAGIEGPGGPSVDACHKNGTCADFNLSPYNSSCAQAFYNAAQAAGAYSVLDEYVSSCVQPSTQGGNIHVVF